MINFGVGYLTIVPPSTAADITPIRVAKLQECSLDFSFTTKELRSNKVFADDVARSGGKLSGKCKTAAIRAGAIGSILTGSTTTTGQYLPKMDVSTGVIASAQFDTAVTLANFNQDLGVDDENGNPMPKVTGAPAAGQYQIDTTTGPNAMYKFNAASNGKTYTVNFVQKDSTAGKLVKYTNQLMGVATKYKLILQSVYQSKNLSCILYAVTVPKIALAFKNEDHTIEDLDFEAQDDGAGNILDMSVAD